MNEAVRSLPKSAQSPTIAQISEIFSSLQGEGVYLGVKQIFARFAFCNLNCSYCDESKKMSHCEPFDKSTEDTFQLVKHLEKTKGPHHAVSLTGGEPLLYTDFIESLAPILRNEGFKIYLETNGSLPDELERIIQYCDFISMDMKLPSAGVPHLLNEHEKFLKIASEKSVFVKVVVTSQTLPEEIVQCVSIVEAIDNNIPFILQPETEGTGINKEAIKVIESEYFMLAKRRLADVRVIPQMHKVWGIK